MQDFGNDDTGLITISYNVVRTFSDTIFSELKIRNIGVRRNYIMEYVDSIYQIKYTDSSIIYLDTVIESKSTGNQIYFKDTTALGNWVQNLEIDVHTMSPVYFLPMYNNTSALKAINWNEKSLNVVIQSNCSDCKYKYLEGFGLASSVMATRIAMGRKSQSKHTLVRISGVTFDPSILPD